eukprot:28167_1
MAEEELGSAEERKSIIDVQEDDHSKSEEKEFAKEFQDKYGAIEANEQKFIDQKMTQDNKNVKTLIDEDKDHQQLLQKVLNGKKGFTCCPTTYQDKVILLIYVVCIVAATALTVIYFVFILNLAANIGCMVGVVVVTWIGVLVGMVTIHNGANVRANAEKVKGGNKVFAQSLVDLMDLKRETLKKIKPLLNEYKALDVTQTELRGQTLRFGGLVTEFQSLREDWPDIDEVFNNLQDTDRILTRLQRSNDRAKLWDYFYEVETDGKLGLNEEEFKAFCARIPERYQKSMKRLKMTEYSRYIDKFEFENMIAKLLDDPSEDACC